jgi:glycosyltransferase involved in cell wall biosynthesis
MRVLQLISSAGYYGAENMLVNLSAALARQGIEVTVGALQHDAEPEVLLRARERDLWTRAFPCHGRLDFSCARNLAAYVRERRIDIIHTHGYKANLYSQLARTDARQVATCHNWAVRSGALGVYSLLDRLALRRVPAIAAVSDNVAQRLADFGLKPPQVRVIANGIEVSRFADARPSLNFGKPFIGCVSRLTAGKGLDILLTAFTQLPSHFHLAIVGSGELDAPLRAQAATLGIADRVHFTGPRTDMPEIYASLDAFLLPSFDEGMPMTVLEAMAAGLPVVATTVGAIQLLGDNRGWLVPPGDSAALAAAIPEALANTERPRHARAHVQTTYSSDAMAAAYLTLYRRL